MTLVKYKKATDYSFYKWIKSYPDSKHWEERIKKCPEVMGYPEINKFYKFIKTAFKNGASTWLNWDKVEKNILQERPDFIQDELKVLKNIFEHLIIFYNTPSIKPGYSIENLHKTKNGYYIEKGFKRGNFYEKWMPVNEPMGGVIAYDEKMKEYKKII